MEYLYVVREGELEVKKNVYESKTQREEYDLLINPNMTKKFNSNFTPVKGLKVTRQINVILRS